MSLAPCFSPPPSPVISLIAATAEAMTGISGGAWGSGQPGPIQTPRSPPIHPAIPYGVGRAG